MRGWLPERDVHDLDDDDDHVDAYGHADGDCNGRAYVDDYDHLDDHDVDYDYDDACVCVGADHVDDVYAGADDYVNPGIDHNRHTLGLAGI